MKKMYKIATVLLAFCFLLGSVPMSVKAEDYKYQVTIFSGKQGSFSGTGRSGSKGSRLQCFQYCRCYRDQRSESRRYRKF